MKNNKKYTDDEKKRVKVNAQVPLKIKEAIEEYARKEDSSQSIVIRKILKKAMEEEGLLK